MNVLSEHFNWKKPKLYRPESVLYDWLIVATLTCACMMVIVDLLGSVIISQQIQGFLAVDDTKAVFLGKSFFLFAAIAPLYAVYMAYVYGFKKMFLVGITTFLTGAVCSGFAATYWTMIVSRAIAGTGGGIVLAITLGYISHILPEKVRGNAILIYSNLFFGLGIAIGSLVGGYFGQKYLWHWVFFINVPLGVVVILSILLLLPETEKVVKPRYDYVSFISIIVCAFSLLLIVTQVKAPWNTLGWYSPFIRMCEFVAAAAFLTLLISSVTVKAPLINMHLFTYPRYCIGCLGMLIIGFMVFGVTIVEIGMLENIYNYQRFTVGVFVSMVGVIYFVVGMVPALTIRYIHSRVFILTGIALVSYSCFQNQLITIQSDHVQLASLVIIRSIGIALVLGPLIELSLSSIRSDEMAKGSAFISFTRLMAATFGSTLISLVMDYRKPFHALRFGEQVNIQSARYKQYISELSEMLISTKGTYSVRSGEVSKQLIIDYIDAQAEIAAFNDALSILGWMTLAILFAIAGLMLYRAYRLSMKLTSKVT